MIPSEECYSIIKRHEGLRLHAYRCPADVPTIGYGATFYPDGRKVQMGDVITKEEADTILKYHVKMFAKSVERAVTSPINQHQFDALVSFSFNVGIGALRSSTLLKRVNVNPNTPNIRDEFMRWVRAGGKVLGGMKIRRKEEANLYFKPVV